MTVIRLPQRTVRQQLIRDEIETLAREAAFTAAVTIGDVVAILRKRLPGDTHFATAWKFWDDLVEAVYTRDQWTDGPYTATEDRMVRENAATEIDNLFKGVGL